METKTHFLSVIFLLIISSYLLVSCCTKENTTSINEDSRIKLKAQKTINLISYSIIEVDGVEYLTSTHGGFVCLSR